MQSTADTEPRQHEKDDQKQKQKEDPDTPSKRLIGKNVSAGNLLK